MADRKISDLTALTTPASGDYVPIVDISEGAAASKNKRVTIQSLFQGIPVNVGIGTSSPSEKLHVSGIILGDSNDNYFGSYSSGGAYLDVGNLATSAAWIDARSTSLANVPLNIRAKGTGEIAFHQTSGEKVRIDSSGRVGIGTISPSHAIHVSGANAVTSSIQLTTTANSDAAIRSTTALGSFAFGTGIGSATNCWNVYDINATTERLRIDSSGNVGIGTSSPGSKLEIRNDVAATTSLDTTAIKLYNNLDGGSGIEFANAVAGKSKISFGVEGVGAGTNETYLGFSTCLEASALAEGMRLTSAGRVGIGTTSPTTLLDVNADTVRVRTARTPASATATGATGEICWDANYIYVCTATNTWRRSAISSW